MVSSFSLSKDCVVKTVASFTLGLPLVQTGARGIQLLRHDSPFTYSFRVFRFGSLIASKTSTDFQSIFDVGELIFSEASKALVFDVVVAGFLSPVVRLLVFPLKLNYSYKRLGSSYCLTLPGVAKFDWKANLAAEINLITLRERHMYRRKTVYVSQTTSNLGLDHADS